MAPKTSANTALMKSGAEFYLKAITGKLKGTVFRLTSQEIFIGRDSSNHISIPGDAKLSRRHARLIFNNGTYFVQNLSSTNFIKINNEKTSQAELKNNYIFSVGSQSFKYVAITDEQTTHLRLAGKSSSKKNQAKSKSMQSNKKLLHGVLALLIISGGALFLTDPNRVEKQSLAEIATTEKILERVEQNQDTNQNIIDEIEQSGKNTSEYKEAHSFYIKGFRDFQKGLYAQALSSFETCLSIFPEHQLARRYSELARNRRDELIAFNFNQGNVNLENGKYNFCISSFKNAMSQINDKTEPRYIEARQLLNRCKILQRSKY
jgi:pSer/pThr/pTyr-binding forkhead associated (FHA) protein